MSQSSKNQNQNGEKKTGMEDSEKESELTVWEMGEESERSRSMETEAWWVFWVRGEDWRREHAVPWAKTFSQTVREQD